MNVLKEMMNVLLIIMLLPSVILPGAMAEIPAPLDRRKKL